MIFIVNDTLGTYGGSQMQICRMGRWAKKNRVKFCVFAESLTNTEAIEDLKRSGARLFEVGILNTLRIAKLMDKTCRADAAVTVLNFTFMHYMDMECVKNEKKLEFTNLMLDIHPKTFELGGRIKNRFVKKIYQNEIKKIFVRMNQSRCLYFMDEVNIQNSEEYLKCRLVPDAQISRVPMEFVDDPGWQQAAREAYGGNVILTVTRAEFPFKGYVLGLIEDFTQLFFQYPGIRLKIIGSGDDVGRIEGKIEALPEQVRENVELHYWMDNEKVKEEMKACRVYIGMGSTLLEAASLYRPAITVRYYTEDNLAKDFIGDAPNIVVQREDCGTRAISLIKQAFEADEDAYLAMCLKSYTKVKEVYDVDKVMGELINAKTQGIRISTFPLRFFHKLHNYIARKRTSSMGFDYESLKKE